MQAVSLKQARALVGDEGVELALSGEAVLIEAGCKLNFSDGKFWVAGYERGGSDVAQVICRLLES